MSLTQSDLQEIEAIFDRKLEPLFGKLTALENDIKEIYKMISDLQGAAFVDKKFIELSVKEKIFRVHAEVVATAKQAGVVLPKA